MGNVWEREGDNGSVGATGSGNVGLRGNKNAGTLVRERSGKAMRDGQEREVHMNSREKLEHIRGSIKA